MGFQARTMEYWAAQDAHKPEEDLLAALRVGCGRYFIGPIQFLVCFGAVVGSTLLAGQSMKSIYLIAKPEGPIKLYVFVIIFGTLMLVLAQLPSFHSLRHVNLVSLLLCLAYSVCATAGSIYAGHTKRAPVKDYSLVGSTQDRVFGVFNAIAIIATTYGNAPVKGKMFKGLCLCYTIVVCTFFGVAISGYWAFGNQAAGTILSNFAADGGATDLIPKWLFTITNVFTLLQLSAVGVVYLQPTNEVLEGLFANPTEGQHSARNVVPRLIFRSLSVILATTLAAMLPFFGDINAVIGAFGFLPLDFVVPSIFYNITFKPNRKSLVFWVNTTITIVFSVLAALGCISAIRQITLDANNYKLFANV
ncbi:GABA transporter 1 [Ananas comosus]|uniref:GABA transporter 1 n=1 Tax=Ananas comosus TaxID=4615 RepID=A0A199UT17_ANACO|nr:GABA transporter 1 [Ananas comosus]